ncbi:acyl-CoA dehydrogenase family protein [Sphingomonas immobilis]|uniref:Acyl-CoA dehydrogenase family protein n=1 Tax=Sphingomonas immobilis TaxID=3063997 RepID=A0ABT9A033_9SPHN|nr:acyl-CoA dehydrogenase family protein [Sphingomonas sp. CA1-15]MDO7842062.1 acyl-CoA dehydrogenase family protein [Sphingomonas sp. CA1-15]
MDLSYGAEAESFRTDVRDFLRGNWQPGALRGSELKAYINAFRLTATEAGYLYRNIPKEFGGSEQPADVVRAQVIREEFGRARAPMEITGNGMNMLVPTLLEKGTPEQKDLFIRKTMSGEYQWGQGYSEPGTGSDLASVRTKGELVGDEWVINGQKIWTSQGDRATHMFALIRTEPQASKHAGISYMLIDLDQPGVTRRPIRQMTGESGFYEFFFDNAKTPASWLIGERGDGWNVSRTTLKHERAAIGSATGLGAQFDKLVELAGEVTRNGQPAIKDPEIRQALTRIEGYVMAHRYSSYRLFSLAAAGEEAGIIQSMMKLLLTETGHEMALAAQELIGDDALVEPASAGTRGRGPEKWLDQIMGSLGNSIAGGTTNIQRNIIAERGLGLPRDLAMETDK